MSSFHPLHVSLTAGQKRKLTHGKTIQISAKQLGGSDVIHITHQQQNKMKKAFEVQNRGSIRIRMSIPQHNHNIKHGGGFWDAITGMFTNEYTDAAHERRRQNARTQQGRGFVDKLKTAAAVAIPAIAAAAVFKKRNSSVPTRLQVPHSAHNIFNFGGGLDEEKQKHQQKFDDIIAAARAAKRTPAQTEAIRAEMMRRLRERHGGNLWSGNIWGGSLWSKTKDFAKVVLPTAAAFTAAILAKKRRDDSSGIALRTRYKKPIKAPERHKPHASTAVVTHAISNLLSSNLYNHEDPEFEQIDEYIRKQRRDRSSHKVL